MKKSTVILSALLIIVFVASVCGARFLLLKIRDQQDQIAELQSAQSAQEESCNSQISELNTQLAALQTTLQSDDDSVAQLNDELGQANDKSDEFQSENDDLNYQLSSLTDYLAQTGGTVDVNDDSRASSIFIPKEVIALLDTFMDASTSGDETLYLSTIRHGPELTGNDLQVMTAPLQALKGKDYTLIKIDAGDTFDVNTLQTGGYFLDLTALDSQGNGIDLASEIFRVGVTFAPETGTWQIYDFD